MIRSPSGSPACWRVRSWSRSPRRPSPSSGPVTSVSVCGSMSGGAFGARSTVDGYSGGRSGGGGAPGGGGGGAPPGGGGGWGAGGGVPPRRGGRRRFWRGGAGGGRPRGG